MAINLIAEYQTKLKELYEATQAAERIIKIITIGAKHLEHWQETEIIGSGKFPSLKRSINAADWPSGQELGQILSHWHTINFEARQAYDQIPDSQRIGIEPPPK